MAVKYDPISPEYRSIIGAISDNEQLNIKIKISGAKTCHLFLLSDKTGEEREYSAVKSGDEFCFTFGGLSAGLYYYRFLADGKKIGKNYYGFGEESENAEDFQLLVYKSGECAPQGFHGGVMYQIFPDRFAAAQGFGNPEGKKIRADWGGVPEYLPDKFGKILNDDFFGGNFEGIRRKVGYLKQLGVTHLYLNPVFKARSNHRYDTGDYLSFDGLLGDESDFSSLVKTLKNNGITLIIDGVFNHTGDDSLYFNKYGEYPSVGAYQSEKSPYFEWYDFSEFPDKYSCWWGIDTLPSIKKGCASFEEFIAGRGGVLDKYLALGVGGVRLDVVDELADGFVRKINEKIKSYGNDEIVIGEVWEDATNKIAYGERRKYFQGGELDSVMNYPLKNALIDYVLSGNGSLLYKTVREQTDNYPFFALNSLMNILGTHDTPRILTVLGKNGHIATERADMAKEKLSEEERTRALKMLKCCSLLQFFLYGVPCIYYGDEQFAEGNKDPFNRTCFIENENSELCEWYSFLSQTRKKYDCFKDGRITDMSFDGGIFSFSRELDGKKIYVVTNAGNRSAIINPNCEVAEITRGIKLSKIRLECYDFAVFYKCGESGVANCEDL